MFTPGAQESLIRHASKRIGGESCAGGRGIHGTADLQGVTRCAVFGVRAMKGNLAMAESKLGYILTKSGFALAISKRFHLH